MPAWARRVPLPPLERAPAPRVREGDPVWTDVPARTGYSRARGLIGLSGDRVERREHGLVPTRTPSTCRRRKRAAAPARAGNAAASSAGTGREEGARAGEDARRARTAEGQGREGQDHSAGSPEEGPRGGRARPAASRRETAGVAQLRAGVDGVVCRTRLGRTGDRGPASSLLEDEQAGGPMKRGRSVARRTNLRVT